MFCAECGAKNEEAVRFCASCGTKVSTASGDASIATPSIVKAAVGPLSGFVEITVYEGRTIGKVASGNWVVEGVPNRSGNLQWAKSLVDSMPRAQGSEKTPTFPTKATEVRPQDTSVDETTYKGRLVKKMADGTWMIDGVWSRFERLQLATDYIDGKASEQVTGKVGAANAAVASPLVVSTASRGNPALGVVGVVCLLGVMGYVILSGTIFKGSALESALDPFGGAETEDKWDKLADQGGLKYSNKYFGLNIISVSSLQYSGGRLKFVQFGVDSEHSPAELRSALSKACKMSPDDFKSTMPGTIRAQGIKGNLTCYYEQGRGNRNHMLIMRK